MGVDQTTFEERPREWRRALDDAELGEGVRRLVDFDGIAVVVGREQGRLYALANRCYHRSGPLHRGTAANGEIMCPWHASTFRVDDGSLVRGPAAYPQPVYDVRVQDGGIVRSGSVEPGRALLGRPRLARHEAISGRRPGRKKSGPRGRSRRR